MIWPLPPLHPPNLNQSQTKALEERLRPWGNPIGGIWGPPGTGKTFVAAYEAIKAILEYGEKVLVCAFENTTVDQTLRNIIAILKSTYGCNKETTKTLVKRIGYRPRIANDIQPFCNHNELARASIVGTTLHSSSSSST